MQTSLKTIIDTFKDFTEKHYQTYSFGFGSLNDINPLDTQYPLVWMSLSPSEMNKTVTTFKINLFILNQTNKDEANLEQIMSDMQRIGRDLVLYYRNSDIDDLFELSDYVRFTPVLKDFDPVLSGWVFDLSIEVIDNNACNLPI